MKMRRPAMIHSHSAKRLVQATAATLLLCSMLARADNCAGGADVTGNECNSAAAHSISEADSRMAHLKGTTWTAEQKVVQARQRQRVANDEVNTAEAQLKKALKALNDAEMVEAGKMTKMKPTPKTI